VTSDERRCLPALDSRGHEIADVDQLGNARTGIHRRQAEVVAQIALRRHAQRAHRQPQQFALCVGAIGIRAAHDVRRQRALGHVVDTLEPPATVRRDRA
jgi:hypothetical protein